MNFEAVCSLPNWQHFLVILLVQFSLGLVNLYMSKTDKVKSNSIAEMVFNFIVSIVRRKQ